MLKTLVHTLSHKEKKPADPTVKRTISLPQDTHCGQMDPRPDFTFLHIHFMFASCAAAQSHMPGGRIKSHPLVLI